jgi:hypothetical protein
MTPDERVLLSNFLRDLTQARGGPKDQEAETMISQALSSNPDAAYLLVQHAVLSDQALHAAQARIAELERGQGQTQGGSFFGASPPQSSGQNAWNQRPSTSVPPSYNNQPDYSQPGYGQAPPQQPSAFSGGGGLGSFLRSAGTMAAGVAAGDLLFEGLSGIFGGHRGYGGGMFGGGMGGGFGGGMFGGGNETIENVTINEYDDGGSSYDTGSDWSDDGN